MKHWNKLHCPRLSIYCSLPAIAVLCLWTVACTALQALPWLMILVLYSLGQRMQRHMPSTSQMARGVNSCHLTAFHLANSRVMLRGLEFVLDRPSQAWKPWIRGKSQKLGLWNTAGGDSQVTEPCGRSWRSREKWKSLLLFIGQNNHSQQAEDDKTTPCSHTCFIIKDFRSK